MKAPTPLELMAFHDGELDEPRAREVRAWLASGREGAALVDNFRALGRHVRTASPRPAPPPDLTDRIFAALDAEPAPRAEPRAAGRAPAAVAREGLAPVVALRRPAPAVAEAKPPATVGEAKPSATRRPPSPAARRALSWAPLGATGMALAAAAAFVLWWSPGGVRPGPGQPGVALTPAGAAFGTDVNTVDFGARMGSIYFVSNDSQDTPVLWIDDDDDDDESDDTP